MRTAIDFRPLLTCTLALSTFASAALFSTGCNRGGDKRQFISVGTAPVGGAFYTVGSAVCEVVNEQAGDSNWRVSAEATGGSMENLRRY